MEHQSGRAKAEHTAAAASRPLPFHADEDGVESATIPLTSGRALAVGYLHAVISGAGSSGGLGLGGEGDVGGREAEDTSTLHDELAYLLMEGLLVRLKC